MRGLIRLLLVAPMLGVPGVLCAASWPAVPTEPELAKLYADARTALEKVSSATFSKPSGVLVWPCDIDERQLRLWAGSLGSDEQDEKDRRNARLMNLDAGMGAEEGKLAVRQAKLQPIKAQCSAGRLEGNIEYALEYLQERRFDKFMQSGIVSKRISVSLTAGTLAPDSLIHVLKRETGRKTVWLDPATQTLMNKQRTAEPDQIVSASIRIPGDKAWSVTLTRAQIGGTPTSFGAYLTVPKGASRREDRLFVGDAVSRIYRYKAGRLHGVQEVAPIKVGEQTVVPGTRQCFEDGEEIKVAQCDVD